MVQTGTLRSKRSPPLGRTTCENGFFRVPPTTQCPMIVVVVTIPALGYHWYSVVFMIGPLDKTQKLLTCVPLSLTAMDTVSGGEVAPFGR